MTPCRLTSLGMTFALALGVMTLGPAAMAAQKGPPSCSKILFRPLAAGQSDGEREAGIYHSRFTHLELQAMVKNGTAEDYYVTSHGKKLPPLEGAVPAAAERCAKEKKMPAPTKAAATCTGQRFATVIAHAGKEKAVLLYGLHDRTWQYCGASKL